MLFSRARGSFWLIYCMLEEGSPYALQSLSETSPLHGRNGWQAGSRDERYHRKTKTDGTNMQTAPLTVEKGQKKKCYNSKAHPWSLKQRKTIMVNNTRVIIKRIAHSLYPLSIQLTFTVPYFQTADEAPPLSPTHSNHTPTGL